MLFENSSTNKLQKLYLCLFLSIINKQALNSFESFSNIITAFISFRFDKKKRHVRFQYLLDYMILYTQLLLYIHFLVML